MKEIRQYPSFALGVGFAIGFVVAVVIGFVL